MPKSQLEAMEAGIPNQQLSDLYRTVIAMTIELGYQYMWINSVSYKTPL